MNIVFIGTTNFSLNCLKILYAMPMVNLKGIVTAPEKFSISYSSSRVANVLHADVVGFAHQKGIPVVKLRNNMLAPDLLNAVEAWQPSAFLVVGWYHMIPRQWREIAPAYGLHASLLPDYSGGAPLVWAMINGESKTGITFFQLDGGVDSGPIVGQSQTRIKSDDTIATLYFRIEQMGLDLVREHLLEIEAGTVRLEVQDESKRRFFPQRSPEDGLIDWRKRAGKIHDFVRAQTRPYPGAFTTWRGRKITIWSSRPVSWIEQPGKVPGQLQRDTDTALVSTGSGALEILEATYGHEDVNGPELIKILGEGAMLGESFR